MKQETNLLKQSGFLAASRMIALCILFSIPIVLVRRFSQSDFGSYKQIFLIYQTIIPILQCGMVASLYYFLPKSGHLKKTYVANTCLFLLLVGILLFLSLNIFSESILEYLNLEHLEPYLFPLSIYVFLMLFAFPIEPIMIIDQKAKKAAFVIIVSDFVRAATMILPVLYIANLLLMMQFILLSAVFRVFILLMYLYKNEYLSIKNINIKYYAPQFGFAFPFGLAVAVQTLSLNIHQYLIAYFFDINIFAIYVVGCFQLPFIPIFYESTTTVLMTRIREFHKEEKIEELVTLWKYFQKKLALLFIPIFVFFFIMAKDVITVLFTEAYLDSVPIFLIMLFNIPVQFFLTNAILRSFGETKYILKVNAAALVLSIFFIYYLLQFFGIKGAAIGVVLSLAVTKGVELIKVGQLCNLSFKTLLPWKELATISLFAAISGIFTYFIKYIAHASPLVSLIGSTLVYSIIYLLMVTKSSLLSAFEKDAIISKWKQILRLS